LRAETAIEATQFGGALLLSLALHVPAYLVLSHLRDASLSAPLVIEASVVKGDTQTLERPQNAPLEPERPAPPMISTRMTPPAATPTPHVRPPDPNTQDHAPTDAQPSGGGVRAQLLSSLEPEPDTSNRNDFVVAPPVPGDENAPLPFAMPPGPGSPAHPAEGAGGIDPPSAGDGEEQAVLAALEVYRLRLFERTMAQAHYPPEAIARGWEGRVLLRLRFGKHGALLDVDVRESSGYVVLDTEAIEMAKRANTQSPIPDILQHRNFIVMIPVIFRLMASAP
jgi:protein TonB